jgi:formylmethanofuran dehydrogenase subunit B
MFFKNVVCPVCGAACDDIQVEFREGAIELKMYASWEMPNLRRLQIPEGSDSPL